MMVENSKHVRVDNWGVFFLQRLQMFFNKTDYCDLTLQFDGNVQLKVHRLVMNACTEYFQVLEQTCDVVDDNIILMPPDLQADVILPIVNFMYTGTLEYHPTIYDRLVHTAELMSIPILIKLLEAHKAGPQHAAHAHKPRNAPLKQPKQRSQNTPHSKKSIGNSLPNTLPGRKLPVWKRKTAPVARSTIVPRDRPVTVPSVDNLGVGGNSGVGALVSAYKSQIEPIGVDNAPRPTRFEWPDGEDEKMKTETYMESSAFDNLTSYSSSPLIKGEDTEKIPIYDELRYTSTSPPSNNPPKRRAPGHSPYTRPPRTHPVAQRPQQPQPHHQFVQDEDQELSPNEEDEDYADDPDYHPDMVMPSTSSLHVGGKRMASVIQSGGAAKRVRFNEKENATYGKGKETSKAGTSRGGEREADLDHSLLISELLKKYPNLAKTSKNIKLKILTKPGNDKPSTNNRLTNPSVKIVMQSKAKRIEPLPNKKRAATSKKVPAARKTDNDGPWSCDKCDNPPDPYHLYYLYRKHMTDVHQEQFSPLMCKYCGKHTKSDRALSFHMHTVHGAALSNIIGQSPFPQCDRCSFSALTERKLLRHKRTHRSGHVQCPQCKVGFSGLHALNHHHQITGHIPPDCDSPSATGMTSYDCQYCTRHWQNSATLFVHLRTAHREDARKDGIVSIDEDPEEDEEEEEEEDGGVEGEMEEGMMLQHEHEEEDPQPGSSMVESKVKILTDVKVGGSDDNTVQMQMTNAGLVQGLGLVDIVVLDENQQYILQSSNGDLEQSEFILPQITGSFVHQGQQVITTSGGQVHQVITTGTQQDSQQNQQRSIITNNQQQKVSTANQAGTTTTDELVMVLTDHDYNDDTIDSGGQPGADGRVQTNGNIVVLYSHPVQTGSEADCRSHGDNGRSLLVQTAEGQVLEIRNGPPDLVDHSSEQESIELIQREINSQQAHIVIQRQDHPIDEEEQQQQLQDHEEHHESAEEDFQDGDAGKLVDEEVEANETPQDDGFHEDADEQEEQVMLVVAEDEEELAEDADQHVMTSSEPLDEEQSADVQDGRIVRQRDDDDDVGQDVCGAQDGDEVVAAEQESEAMEVDETEQEDNESTPQDLMNTSANTSTEEPTSDFPNAKSYSETALPRTPSHKSPDLQTIEEEETQETYSETKRHENAEATDSQTNCEAAIDQRQDDGAIQDGDGNSPEAMEVDSSERGNKDADTTDELDDSIAEHGLSIDKQLIQEDKDNVANSTFEDDEDNEQAQVIPHITGEDDDVVKETSKIIHESNEENECGVELNESSKNDIESGEVQQTVSNINGENVAQENHDNEGNVGGQEEASEISEFAADQIERNMENLHSSNEESPSITPTTTDTQSTKTTQQNSTIALLDEWEDTEDSSSQDKNCQTTVISTTPNAVNKLINDDWDDDE